MERGKGDAYQQEAAREHAIVVTVPERSSPCSR